MRCRFGVGEGSVGKAQSLVDPTEHPQCEGIKNLGYGARIVAEPVGEIGVARLIAGLDGFLKMLMAAGKIAEIEAGDTGNSVCDRGLRAIRLRCGFAQEKLGHFVHRGVFATGEMAHPKTVIGEEPFGGVFLPARQFAGTRKGRAGFRRRMSLGPNQRIAQARL
jgi:hypothetical protein